MMSKGGSELPVEGRAAAGHPFAGKPSQGTATRIFTGAVVPDGHDTVVMQEDVRFGTIEGESSWRSRRAKRGANVRKAGEDVKPGETVLGAGAVLRPQDLSALASLGFGEIGCFQRLKVAIVSTGDEVGGRRAPNLEPARCTMPTRRCWRR